MPDEEGVGYEGGGYEEAAQPAQEAAPEWSAPGQEWYEQREQEGQQFGQFMQQALPVLQQINAVLNEPEEQQYDQSYDQQQYDPQFADDRDQFLQQQIQQLVGGQVEQALEPFKPLLGMIANREGETMAKTQLDALTSEVGKFDHDQALVLGSAYMEQGVEPDQALKMAAQQQHEFEQRIREEAIREYEENLRKRAGAPVEPASNMGAAGEVQPVPKGPDRYEQMAERFFSQRNLQTTP